MKKDLNKMGVIILIGIFLLFYIVTAILLDKKNISKNVINTEEPVIEKNDNYDNEKNIVSSLYKEVKILYDVVNNRFKVSQEDTITMGDIIYKKIINFDEVMNNLFTPNGINKYINDLGNYFAYSEDGYYLAGNLVTYQTFYFRGDETNIYVTNSNANEINAIIYERWTSNNKNTLATIKVINSEGKFHFYLFYQ